MKAEIISIGDELLVGQTVNTNASWIAYQLNLQGIEVLRITTISDTHDEIKNSLQEAAGRATAVLITGGLGPTRDDITKQALCDYFGSSLVFHEPSYKNIIELFGSRGLPVRDVNRRQAEIPHNCIPIHNANGTAPGMWFEKGGIIYVSMPGVPFEMQPMMRDFIIPELLKIKKGDHIVHKMIMTQGVGESFLAEIIGDWEDHLPGNFKVAYLPQPGMVRLRITGRGNEPHALEKELGRLTRELAELIPQYVYGYDEESPEEVIGRLLKEKSATLSTAESCTGGYIAHLITSVPGSSAYFTGSVIAYSNTIKTSVLGVKEQTLKAYGAVSEQTVTEMDEGIRRKFNTDYSIAVSGIAGPDGGTPQKPVGTIWIAVAGPRAALAKKFLFGKNRERNIRLAALSAINALRMAVMEQRI